MELSKMSNGYARQYSMHPAQYAALTNEDKKAIPHGSYIIITEAGQGITHIYWMSHINPTTGAWDEVGHFDDIG